MRAHARGLVLLAAFLIALPPAFAGDGAKDSKCAKKGGGFGALFLGEGGQTYAPSCDQNDFQTEQGFQQGKENAPAEDSGREQERAGQGSSAAAPVVRPAGPSSAVRAAPAWGTGAARAWPGPRRPGQGEGSAPAVTPKEGPAVSAPQSSPDGSVPMGDEPLRDAPAAVDPMRYSLWAGLNAPLLLPGSKVGDVPLEQAKISGRADYASHILGEEAKALGPSVSGPDLVGGAAPAGAESSEGLFVSLEIDLSGTLRDAVSSLTQRSGFRPDEKFTPSYSDEAKTRVMLRGWVPPHRLGEVLGPEVHRLQVHRSSKPESEGARTELLVGLSIPTGASPSAVLTAATARLSLRSGFEVRKVIGYQTIPGTSRMVIILSGQVPVSNISKVMGDPSVVKVVPSPDSAVAAPAPAQSRKASERFLAYAASHNPVLLLLAVLLTLSLAGTAFARSR